VARVPRRHFGRGQDGPASQPYLWIFLMGVRLRTFSPENRRPGSPARRQPSTISSGPQGRLGNRRVSQGGLPRRGQFSLHGAASMGGERRRLGSLRTPSTTENERGRAA
jgi:hypothetical protein